VQIAPPFLLTSTNVPGKEAGARQLSRAFWHIQHFGHFWVFGNGTPSEDRIAAVPYVQIQSAGDSLFPRGRRYYWKAQFMREITDEAIDVLLASYATAPKESLVIFQQVGGAIARVPISESPYGNRDLRRHSRRSHK